MREEEHSVWKAERQSRECVVGRERAVERDRRQNRSDNIRRRKGRRFFEKASVKVK